MNDEQYLLEREHEYRNWDKEEISEQAYDPTQVAHCENKEPNWNTSMTSCCQSAFTDDDDEQGRCMNCGEMSLILYIND